MGFSNCSNISKCFSRFKINFEKHLEIFFHLLVELTEPICRKINSELSHILIVDTTGIEASVKENNPKLFDTILKQSKKLQKSNSDFNAHSYTCSKMSNASYANSDIKLSYINGHYCYALKTAIVTNRLGIIRSFDFFENSTPT